MVWREFRAKRKAKNDAVAAFNMEKQRNLLSQGTSGIVRLESKHSKVNQSKFIASDDNCGPSGGVANPLFGRSINEPLPADQPLTTTQSSPVYSQHGVGGTATALTVAPCFKDSDCKDILQYLQPQEGVQIIQRLVRGDGSVLLQHSRGWTPIRSPDGMYMRDEDAVQVSNAPKVCQLFVKGNVGNLDTCIDLG
eukprot:COSAG01_NODE_18906_length_1045_cov_0.752643_2_plen_193_part_01